MTRPARRSIGPPVIDTQDFSPRSLSSALRRTLPGTMQESHEQCRDHTPERTPEHTPVSSTPPSPTLHHAPRHLAPATSGSGSSSAFRGSLPRGNSSGSTPVSDPTSQERSADSDPKAHQRRAFPGLQACPNLQDGDPR